MQCIVVAITVGFSNLFLLFLNITHVDFYLEKFSLIYYIGQIFVIRESIPF